MKTKYSKDIVERLFLSCSPKLYIFKIVNLNIKSSVSSDNNDKTTQH